MYLYKNIFLQVCFPYYCYYIVFLYKISLFHRFSCDRPDFYLSSVCIIHVLSSLDFKYITSYSVLILVVGLSCYTNFPIHFFLSVNLSWMILYKLSICLLHILFHRINSCFLFSLSSVLFSTFCFPFSVLTVDIFIRLFSQIFDFSFFCSHSFCLTVILFICYCCSLLKQ